MKSIRFIYLRNNFIMKYLKEQKKSYSIKGNPIFKMEFVQFVKDSEESGKMDFEKGLEIIEVRLAKHRKFG